MFPENLPSLFGHFSHESHTVKVIISSHDKSSNDTTLWCNVQLTKDGIGVCLPNINLDNCTDIVSTYPRVRQHTWLMAENYLLPYTSIVNDAHKAGLEIYAADFANDNILSFNYSYDPVAGYLMFINNGVFSVDGLLTDFPITPSEAIVKFKQLTKYKLVYQIDKSIRDAISSSVADIKRFANAVALGKQSIYPSSMLFFTLLMIIFASTFLSDSNPNAFLKFVTASKQATAASSSLRFPPHLGHAAISDAASVLLESLHGNVRDEIYNRHDSTSCTDARSVARAKERAACNFHSNDKVSEV
ncbi:hypothetical protein ZIOFF_068540 [Zingiber officinale]|uniref:glycerophosphodiester phosphodiesterase n=1 Tax=Zingiber officinale TaxID=94328 RepID=A0A8J5ERX9_ZINOF|nr:hypothetical protein ZIOFF_068540 [Zingiber officinale]